MKKGEGEEETDVMANASSDPGAKVWVGNLPPTATEYQVLKLAEPFGKIAKLDFVYGVNARGGRVPRGFAFVSFANAAAASRAVAALDGAKMGGKTLKVSLAHSRDRGISGVGGKRTLEQARAAMSAGGDGPSRAEKIRAMEAKLKAMQAADGADKGSFKLAVLPESSKSKAGGSSSSSHTKKKS